MTTAVDVVNPNTLDDSTVMFLYSAGVENAQCSTYLTLTECLSNGTLYTGFIRNHPEEDDFEYCVVCNYVVVELS